MPKTGVDVLIKVNDTVIGGQRGATFNTEIATIDATHKDAAGWGFNIAGQGSWSIDCNGVVLAGNDPGEERMSLLALHQAYKAKEALDVEFSDPTGLSYRGQAIMTSLPIEAPMDDVMTYTTAFQGQGEYEIVDAAGAPVEGQSAGIQTMSTAGLKTVTKESTKAEIQAELDRLNVSYTESDTKDELLRKYGEAQ